MKRIRLLLTLTFLLFFLQSAKGGLFYPLSKLKRTDKQQSTTKIEKKQTSIQLPQLTLSAVITSNNKKIALINGLYLKEGDKIDICTVKKITASPPSVILNCKGIKLTLKINLID